MGGTWRVRLDAAGCGEAEIAQSSGKGLGCHRDATCPVRHGDCHLSLSGEATRPHGTGQLPRPRTQARTWWWGRMGTATVSGVKGRQKSRGRRWHPIPGLRWGRPAEFSYVACLFVVLWFFYLSFISLTDLKLWE